MNALSCWSNQACQPPGSSVRDSHTTAHEEIQGDFPALAKPPGCLTPLKAALSSFYTSHATFLDSRERHLNECTSERPEEPLDT